MKINRTWMCMLIITGSLLTVGVSAIAASADKQLQKGIEAYQQNDTDKALDYFIDVLMNGNNEQVAQANKYIDAIHNQIGGIKRPVEVDVSFPDQPVQTVLTNTDNWVRQNSQNMQGAVNQAGQTAQNAIAELNAAPASLTEQIEQRQLASYTQQGMQPVTATQEAILDSAAVLSNQAAEGAATVRNDLNAISNQYSQQVNQYGQQVVNQAQTATQSYMDDIYQLANDYETEYPGLQSAVPTDYQIQSMAGQPLMSAASQPVAQQPVYTASAGATDTQGTTGAQGYVSPNLSPAAYAERNGEGTKGGFTPATNYGVSDSSAVWAPSQTATASMETTTEEGNSSAFVDLTSPAAVEARNLYTAQKLQSMQDGAIAALTADKGVHLYLRSDGRPDAIDIDEEVLFQGNSFRTEAFGTLNDIYELLALTEGARYIILPAGSYTDDVTLSGIRQAMALKSYLTKRGISQGKLYYNMGLIDEEVPTQFSNLKGLSVVFDYDANLPTRLLENAEKETAPLLSMAVVPPCHAIDRSLGEAYAIDFSVLETEHPINNWVLQIVQHGRNGNYYIVRQLEGFGPVYHQILWNGRKGIVGPELPCGKYTLVLSGVDSAGNKKVLRRRVVVKCAGAAVMGSCQSEACTKKQKTSTQKVTGFNYKAARLWNKPGRVMHCSSGCRPPVVTEEETVTVAVTTDAPAAAVNVEEENAVASSTSSGTYTKTETVRNIVVDDTSSQPGSAYSSTDGGYAPMPSDAGGYSSANAGQQYESASYENEYTAM